MTVVLGCSPGTRTFGVAIIRDNELLDYEAKTFRGKWAPSKLERILTRIEIIIDIYKIRRIAVKVPDKFPRSIGYNQLIGRLNVLFERKGMNVTYYTLSELKRHCSPHFEIGKEDLADYIVGKFPELHVRHEPSTGQPNNHHFKVFEAVCAAKMSNGLK